MPLTLYAATIPPFIRGLTSLSAILTKAVNHANETSTPLSTYLATTLFPDMAGLAFQIQRASDTAKAVPMRVASLPPVSMPDTETTFEELQERIAKTIEVLKGIKEEDINGKEEVEVLLKTPFGEVNFRAQDYVLQYAMPNFYFHVTAAYAILRHVGVPLGKLDYLGYGK